MDRQDLVAAPRRWDMPRVWLETPQPAHAAAFLDSFRATLPVLTYVAWGQRQRELPWAIDFCEWDARCVEQGDGLIFSAFERASGAYIGRIDLHSFDFEAPRCEIGYFGDVRLAGRGLMREAALGVLELGFSIGLARIQALSNTRNVRALHFADSLGMTREGVLRHFERDPQGRLADMVMYAALNPDLD